MSKKELSHTEIVPLEAIERRIYVVRGEKVMLDSDLAALYQVTTGISTWLSAATQSVFRMILCSN